MGFHKYWALTLVVATLVMGDDNLREALQAVKKRQRDLTPPMYYSRPYIYSDGQPEDIGYGYQKSVSPNTAGVFDNMPVPYSELGTHDLEDDQDRALEKFLMDYIEDSEPRTSKFGGSKRSVFRERDPEGLRRLYEEENEENRPASPFRERDKARLQAAHALVSNYGGLNVDRSRYLNENNDDDYLAVLNSIWEKYRGEEDPEELSETDMEEILDYLQGKEEEKRQYGNFNTGYDFFNSPLGWKRSREQQQHHHQKRYPDTLFDERYPYKGQKRYPITKRSPSFYGPAMPLERRKKSEIKKTDPKVAAELNNIFDTSSKNKTETTETPKIVSSTSSAPGQKEQTIEAASSKPLEVKKKSVNWSDYFGYDRKKKSSDWVVDQYLRSYGLNGDAYDKPKKKEDIDSKMRAMEDLIVDEAIKYTGAHEGSRDNKEIQEVKDKVMAQLAAAYSLEKMRRALGEFKASIAAQKSLSRSSHSLTFPKASDDGDQLQKRVAVKKEMAENTDEGKFEKKDRPHRQEEDENKLIKQAATEEKSAATQKYNEENVGECTVFREIEISCKKVTRTSLGEVGYIVFLPLCTLHQICYLCGPELGASSPRSCDTTFANESQVICHGNPACLYSSRLILSTLKRYRMYEQECDWRHHQCLAQFLKAVTRR